MCKLGLDEQILHELSNEEFSTPALWVISFRVHNCIRYRLIWFDLLNKYVAISVPQRYNSETIYVQCSHINHCGLSELLVPFTDV